MMHFDNRPTAIVIHCELQHSRPFRSGGGDCTEAVRPVPGLRSITPLTSRNQAAWVRVVPGCAYDLGRGDHGNGPQAFPADGRRHLILALHSV